MEPVGGKVVVVDDDPAQRKILARWLENAGYEVELFEDGKSLLRGLSGTLPEVVCLDLHMPGMDGIETLDRVREHYPHLPVIMLTADDAAEPIVTAIRLGAFEYLRKPVDRQKLLTVVRNAVGRYRMSLRLVQLEHEVRGWDYAGMIGESEPMLDLFRQMDRVAPTDVTVLVHGESGTGKELVARAIHDASSRRSGPFVALNCAAIPESLQESELFGHERGAFTGASQRRAGRFEQAHGGTLLLDEIAELSPALQAQLLRVVQEQRFFRVGGSTEVRSDFRLLTATHRDLAARVRDGRFREDLYFRLAVLQLRVPALRERGGDVSLLAETFGKQFGADILGGPVRITAGAMAALSSYAWPGNVRELQNVMQRAVVLSPEGEIDIAALPQPLRDGYRSASLDGWEEPKAETIGALQGVGDDTAAPANDPRWEVPDVPLEALEREAVRAALVRSGGNLAAAARRLGIARTTLYRKMEQYEIKRD